MPASDTAISSIDSAAAGTLSRPVGPALTPPRSRPGREAVPRIGTGRVCATAAGMAPRLIHSRTSSTPMSSTVSVGEAPPAVVGLGAGEDQDVAAPEAGGPERDLRPVQRRQPAVADLERGPARPVVEQLVRIEAGDDRCVRGEDVEHARGRGARVHPAVEGGEHDGLGEVGSRFLETVERHGGSLRVMPRGRARRAVGPMRPLRSGRSAGSRARPAWFKVGAHPGRRHGEHI